VLPLPTEKFLGGGMGDFSHSKAPAYLGHRRLNLRKTVARISARTKSLYENQDIYDGEHSFHS